MTSDRRREVLQLIADGYRREEIAATMFITLETVKCHLREVRWDLRTRTTAQAVAVAMRNGLIQ
jgi:DNA-binding NarL/FixJ family response regulator